jgi:hypothetical protein
VWHLRQLPPSSRAADCPAGVTSAHSVSAGQSQPSVASDATLLHAPGPSRRQEKPPRRPLYLQLVLMGELWPRSGLAEPLKPLQSCECRRRRRPPVRQRDSHGNLRPGAGPDSQRRP